MAGRPRRALPRASAEPAAAWRPAPGRLLDTAKSADLGGTASTLLIDLNFLYHPSCRYADSWQCPLAPPGNTISVPVNAGERL